MHIARKNGANRDDNKPKAKIMVIDKTNTLELTGGLNLQIVWVFVYLGSTDTMDNGSHEPDVHIRNGIAKYAVSKHKTLRDSDTMPLLIRGIRSQTCI